MHIIENLKYSVFMAATTRKVMVGNVAIGGGAPISIQSMTNANALDFDSTLQQVERLVESGCHIVRIAVPSKKSLRIFAQIKKRIRSPLVADIQFDYRLAIGAIDAGADKVRINPGNIGGREKVKPVVQMALSHGIPIRIGVNSGSIEKDILQKEGGPTVRALVESALRSIDLVRDCGTDDIVLSLKSSNVLKTIRAYREVAQKTDVPLHVGVTEAGTVKSGSIRSAVALGILLSDGIGDTIRVSLTGDPVEEVYAARLILQSLELAPKGLTIISCPTCGRTEVDLVAITEEVEKRLMPVAKPLTVAIMGCVVNGPGEAREADIGVACGKKSAVLFKKGQVIKKITEERIADELVDEVLKWNY